jgi:chromosome segregation ATPase
MRCNCRWRKLLFGLVVVIVSSSIVLGQNGQTGSLAAPAKQAATRQKPPTLEQQLKLLQQQAKQQQELIAEQQRKLLQLQQQLQQSNSQLQQQNEKLQTDVQHSLQQLTEANRRLGELKGEATPLQNGGGQPTEAVSPPDSDKRK